jgi:hypothetical protein
MVNDFSKTDRAELDVLFLLLIFAHVDLFIMLSYIINHVESIRSLSHLPLCRRNRN